MPFKRKGRPTYYFKARTRLGSYVQLSTGMTKLAAAREVEAMWSSLARDHRAWDVLDPVLAGSGSIGHLCDRWRESHGRLADLRLLLNDVDVSLLVPAYLAEYSRTGVATDTVSHTANALQWLFTPGQSMRASNVTTSWLSERLAAYPASASTRRKVWSEWNGYFKWLVQVRQAISTNPLTRVPRPAQKTPPIEFYELEEVRKIAEWQPTNERRALMAFLYGTACEVSVALLLTRDDILPSTRMVRTRGTKAHSRDRMVRVDDWAWEIFWEFARYRLSGKLFSVQSRHTASKWHRTTVHSLGLGKRFPLKNARHHWAATHLRAGYPIGVVQSQMGHAEPTLTLRLYGRFIPDQHDHDRLQENLRRDSETHLVAMAGAR